MHIFDYTALADSSFFILNIQKTEYCMTDELTRASLLQNQNQRRIRKPHLIQNTSAQFEYALFYIDSRFWMEQKKSYIFSSYEIYGLTHS